MLSPHLVTVRPAKVTALLGAVVFGLVAIHLGLQYLRFSGAEGVLVYTIAGKFNFDGETTVPTYFSCLLLLGVGLLLGSITSDQETRRDRWTWGMLAVVFLSLSLEEAVDFHNALGKGVGRRLGGTEGWARSAWVIPAMGLVLLFVMVYFRFFLRLPRRFQVLFAVSGVLYVGGAIGGEMLGGWHIELHGSQNFAYVLISTAEEAMEMLGMVTFSYALLLFKELYGHPVRVQFAEAAASRVASEPRSQREVV